MVLLRMSHCSGGDPRLDIIEIAVTPITINAPVAEFCTLK